VSVRAVGFASAILVCSALGSAGPAYQGGWPTYGGDPGGTRYSQLTQIDSANVTRLKVAWIYHTGALNPPSGLDRYAAFEATPILFDGTLYLSTPFDQIAALDPASGKERWKYDPHLDRSAVHYTVTSRGVATWKESRHDAAHAPCRKRVFLGTLDARLIAVDAETGNPCAHFGANGAVDLSQDVEFRSVAEYMVTSPPTVVGDVVIVGSSIGDNQAVDEELGVVRGFDARSGKLLWSWDPIPWARKQNPRTGAGNAWSVISADVQRGLIFVPTGSASPDYYGGLRRGDNAYANSVAALEAATGKLVWSFQVVHHDLWDYDVASEPLLFMFGQTPALAITTKMGFVFVLDRVTGKPLYPVQERSVPRSDVPGEQAAPTQPFPSLPALVPQKLSPSDAWGLTPRDRAGCREKIAALWTEGIYTPPSTRGTLLYPGNVGGVNWGSAALNPQTGILYANTNRVAFLMKLVPRDSGGMLTQLYKRLTGTDDSAYIIRLIRQQQTLKNRFTGEFSTQDKTPYSIYREAIMSEGGLPCTPQPWGAVSALNLNTGQKAWEAPLGTMIAGENTGSINLGGPIVTAGGLVFAAASTDPYIRAFDASSGRELWKGELPVPAQATPMTYSVAGKQYVVICAGGHGQMGTKLGDSVVAFALPEARGN
jgi:quinoprotein glucose dehydrogenase